ncbi:hypothetical protein MKW92_042633 [Papaver armeniacum]|nr:hypothetical protein MKW92_042633 [Papaver armeniacum]
MYISNHSVQHILIQIVSQSLNLFQGSWIHLRCPGQKVSLHIHLTELILKEAAFPALPKERNDDSESEDRPEHQQSGYGFLSGTEKEVSVGINGILSQDEKTVDDSDSKDSESKYKEIRDETPELIEKSKARDSSENSEEISCATMEIPDKLKIFHVGNEETEELERIEGGKRGKSKDTAYMVMLESYVLQLLCVQKVLKKEGTSEHEPLSQ